MRTASDSARARGVLGPPPAAPGGSGLRLRLESGKGPVQRKRIVQMSEEIHLYPSFWNDFSTLHRLHKLGFFFLNRPSGYCCHRLDNIALMESCLQLKSIQVCCRYLRIDFFLIQ